MNNKRWISLFLAGSLLLLPVTSYYAISWKDVKALQWKDLQKKASAFISEDTMKIMPGVILALGLAAGGLYYYLTSKKENPIRSLVTQDYVWPTLEQFQVYCQFNANGGGEASCGYQTLLRAMQLVASKSKNQDEGQLQRDLMDPKFIAQYFGKDGGWRNAIIKRRRNDEDGGEWLNDEELEYLWRTYKTSIIPQGVECDFFAIPNFSIVGTEFSELENYIKDDVRPFLTENNHKKLFRIFALGTMRQVYGEKAGTKGHWYPLIMYQNEEGKRKYYIMDSGSWNKTNRLEDTNAWKVINLIEQ